MPEQDTINGTITPANGAECPGTVSAAVKGFVVSQVTRNEREVIRS